jgi:hypothetical protein
MRIHVKRKEGGSTMRFSRRVLSGVAAFLVIASPLGAFTLIESVGNQQKVMVARGDAFRVVHVRLAQIAMGDGSVKLEPGEYSVGVSSMGDGSVVATFFDVHGRKAGEAHGIITVGKTAQSPAASPRDPAIHFAPLGFSGNSRSSFSQLGNKLNLEILSSDGSRSILIGLLLPAVQNNRH